MLRLLTTFSWQELRHHPWRSAVAVLAVTLGVALAFAVQLINASALAEFGQAVAAVNGQPDAELRARHQQRARPWATRRRWRCASAPARSRCAWPVSRTRRAQRWR